jgi:cytidine deaminase
MQNVMLQKTKENLNLAYCKYSKFAVSACIMDENGELHFGVNVENASYPLGSCAEAIAIGNMVLAGGKKIKKILVNARGGVFCSPCGGCRQRILEFADSNTIVLVANDNGIVQEIKMNDLIPYPFKEDAFLNNL